MADGISKMLYDFRSSNKLIVEHTKCFDNLNIVSYGLKCILLYRNSLLCCNWRHECNFINIHNCLQASSNGANHYSIFWNQGCCLQ